jgi:bacterioferritin
LISERIAIQTYRAMLQYLGDKDTTTCMVVQKLLAQEEEHATDLQGFLGGTHESLLEETSRKVA